MRVESEGILVDYKKLNPKDYENALRKKLLRKRGKSQLKRIEKN